MSQATLHFPNHHIRIVFSALVSGTLDLIQFPKQIEVGLSQHLSLPVQLLQKINSVVIIVDDYPFSLTFVGTGKLGSNTTIKFDLYSNAYSRYYPSSLLLNQYNAFFNFEECNYLVKSGNSNRFEAYSHFKRLANPTIGFVQIEDIDHYLKFLQNHWRIKLLDPWISDFMILCRRDREFRVNTLEINSAWRTVDNIGKLIIEEKLIIIITEDEEWNLRLVDSIDLLPNSIEIRVTNCMNCAFQLLLLISKKKKDLKSLTVKIIPCTRQLPDYLQIIYMGIGAFQQLEKLNISVFENDKDWYKRIRELLDLNISLRKVEIFVIAASTSYESKQLSSHEIKKIQQELQYLRLVPCHLTFSLQT
ncbi:hypothetical protein FGO68_gene13857 [Halteria grandinella]|uniref:Uncharacterized protein n=1 Tax=Halteria grandinella TaxID=5974 RepID=A0A8J8T927_HALGN|nr:hypothetical protein FGO68_gene13857 [Halteria grandinella]